MRSVGNSFGVIAELAWLEGDVWGDGDCAGPGEAELVEIVLVRLRIRQNKYHESRKVVSGLGQMRISRQDAA